MADGADFTVMAPAFFIAELSVKGLGAFFSWRFSRLQRSQQPYYAIGKSWAQEGFRSARQQRSRGHHAARPPAPSAALVKLGEELVMLVGQADLRRWPCAKPVSMEVTGIWNRRTRTRIYGGVEAGRAILPVDRLARHFRHFG